MFTAFRDLDGLRCHPLLCFYRDVICFFACGFPRNYQTYLSIGDHSSLFEGVVTESENKEMKIEDDIPKEVLSRTSLTSYD